MKLHVDPIARQHCGGIRARQEQRMAWNPAKMLHHDSCAQLMGGLRGLSADFQDLAKRAERVSSRLGSVIRA